MSRANELTKAVIDYLRLKGVRCWRSNSVGIFDPTKKVFRKPSGSSTGIADVTGLRKPMGQHIEVEIKRVGEKQRQSQIDHQKSIEEMGGLYFLTTSIGNFIEQWEWLERYGWQNKDIHDPHNETDSRILQGERR